MARARCSRPRSALRSPRVTRTIGLIYRSNEKLPLVAKVFQRFLLDFFACIDSKGRL